MRRRLTVAIVLILVVVACFGVLPLVQELLGLTRTHVEPGPTYAFVSAWRVTPVPNDDPGAPLGIAVGRDGSVYAVDGTAHRVRRYTHEGAPVAEWGSRGAAAGQFRRPLDVAVDAAGMLYVLDLPGRVQSFTSDGKLSTSATAPAGFDVHSRWTSALALDRMGNVYVADFDGDCVRKLATDGRLVTKWGCEGTGQGEFRGPADVAADGMGNVYVMDWGNRRIQRFTTDGRFVMSWVVGRRVDDWLNPPTGDLWEDWPGGITTDRDGNVFVADNRGSRVCKFNPDGVLLRSWGSRGDSEGEFNRPWGIAVDASGNVYVGDTGNGRIQKFAPVK